MALVSVSEHLVGVSHFSNMTQLIIDQLDTSTGIRLKIKNHHNKLISTYCQFTNLTPIFFFSFFPLSPKYTNIKITWGQPSQRAATELKELKKLRST